MADNAPCPAPAEIERKETLENGRRRRPRRLGQKTAPGDHKVTGEDPPAKKTVLLLESTPLRNTHKGAELDGNAQLIQPTIQTADTAKGRGGGRGRGRGNGGRKGRGTPATGKKRKDRGHNTDSTVLSGPYKIIHRWSPLEKAQAYMMGTIGGKKNKIITNISAMMDHDFSRKMLQLCDEAKRGLFSIKEEAVLRRDQLLVMNLGVVQNLVGGKTADTAQASDID